MANSIVTTPKFWRTTAIFVVLWGPLIAVMIALPLYLKGHRSTHDMQMVVLLCVLGGSIAAFLTRIFSHWITKNRAKTARFAATLGLLSAGTVATTATLFALQFRTYFSQWHEEILTVEWAFQLVFTLAYSSYIYGSTALHLLISPMNVVVLILCAWIFEPRN
ncbi:MAG: hypothetical protein JKX91_08255 [Rhizobiaceae bacterium]|nr:hypothetical protein [Rhizobiaceae bacterium]